MTIGRLSAKCLSIVGQLLIVKQQLTNTPSIVWPPALHNNVILSYQGTLGQFETKDGQICGLRYHVHPSVLWL